MFTRVFGWLACAGAVALLVVAMVSGTSPAAAAAAGVRVTAATVQLAVVPGRPAAGYFTLTAGTTPAELTDVIWDRLGISPNWRSSGAVTDEVITSGLAPG